MHDFLTANRNDLIERCRAKVAERSSPRPTEDELEFGVPLFLDQLIKTLKLEQTAAPAQAKKVSGSATGKPEVSEIGASAVRHGRELLRHGFTIDQVVHDYGDLCQAITDLAVELETPFETDEFRTLNRCLDNGIADAVKEFSTGRDSDVADKQTDALNERLGFFAHELRNHLNTATLALTAMKAGNVGMAGATGGVLDRSLVGLRTLIDRTLTEVRLTAGMPARHRLFPVADFIAEARFSASLEANVRGCALTVADVDPGLFVDADRDLLLAAVGNLLQNAFKFTRPHTEVSLRANAAGDRVLIEVEDHCGGLLPGCSATMFLPFAQGGADKTGLGLGLSISQHSVEANAGSLGVRDIPGSGCVFTIDLPLHSQRKRALAPVTSSAKHE